MVVVLCVVVVVVVVKEISLDFSAYRPGQTPVLLLLSMSDMWGFLLGFWFVAYNAVGNCFKSVFLYKTGGGFEGGCKGVRIRICTLNFKYVHVYI